jgi:cytoskeletal protein RodZ
MTRKRLRVRAGAKLKRARERCGLSLRQIADATKISISVLEGLERDDIKYLPAGVLGRGYVRSFAEAVKLDPETIVAEFVAQFPESSVKHGYPPSERIEEDKAAEVRASRSLRIRLHASGTGMRVASVAVIAVVLAGVVAVAAPKRWPPWSALQSLADSMDMHPGKRLASLRSRLIPLLRPSKPPTLTSPLALPVTTTAHANAKADVAVPEASRTSGTSTDTLTRFDKPLKIALSANSQSWVIATVDGKVAINRFFEMGDQETLEAKRELAVTAGNGGSIVMTVNGAVTRSLGRTGKTVTVRVNRDNLEQYLKRGQ